MWTRNSTYGLGQMLDLTSEVVLELMSEAVSEETLEKASGGASDSNLSHSGETNTMLSRAAHAKNNITAISRWRRVVNNGSTNCGIRNRVQVQTLKEDAPSNL